MRTALAYTAILLLAGCATTGPTSSTRYWKLEGCTNLPNPRVNFNRQDGTRIATIDRLVCERVQTAATKIQNAASYQVSQIYITDLEAVNAFATFDKNGKSFVIANIGMLQAIGADEDAWAGLLGHEIAHLVRNHREGRQEAKSAAEVGGQVVGNILSFLVPGVGGWAAGTVGGTATQWAMYGAYTRPQEAEADQLGLTWMVAAGYDPRGLTRLFEILSKQSSLPAFLSTHPGGEDRAKSVQDYVNKTGQVAASPDSGQRQLTVSVSPTPSAREKAELVQKPSSDLEKRFAAAREANERKPENNAVAVAKGSSRWVWGTSWSAGTENRTKELALDYCRKQASKEGIADPCRVYSLNGRVVYDDAK